MLFSRRSATSVCAIVLIVMAVTPYHRFSSSIGLASGAMTWLVILGACLARIKGEPAVSQITYERSNDPVKHKAHETPCNNQIGANTIGIESPRA